MTRVVLLDSVDTWRECALGGILGWRASSDRADLVGTTIHSRFHFSVVGSDFDPSSPLRSDVAGRFHFAIW